MLFPAKKKEFFIYIQSLCYQGVIQLIEYFKDFIQETENLWIFRDKIN